MKKLNLKNILKSKGNIAIIVLTLVFVAISILKVIDIDSTPIEATTTTTTEENTTNITPPPPPPPPPPPSTIFSWKPDSAGSSGLECRSEANEERIVDETGEACNGWSIDDAAYFVNTKNDTTTTTTTLPPTTLEEEGGGGEERYYNFENKPYFKFSMENGLCINLDSRRISDQNNCEYEDRLEEALKLDEPKINGNDTIVFDLLPSPSPLPPNTSEPELPLSPSPSPSLPEPKFVQRAFATTTAESIESQTIDQAAVIINETTDNSSSTIAVIEERKGYILYDHQGNYYFDNENCSTAAGSSGVGTMSECEWADAEVAKERALNEPCQIVLPDGYCVQEAESIEEDLDDAPKWNQIIDYTDQGHPVYYCTAGVVIVGMPCSNLESEEERKRNDQYGKGGSGGGNDTLIWEPRSCPPRQACVHNDDDRPIAPPPVATEEEEETIITNEEMNNDGNTPSPQSQKKEEGAKDTTANTATPEEEEAQAEEEEG